MLALNRVSFIVMAEFVLHIFNPKELYKVSLLLEICICKQVYVRGVRVVMKL